MKTVPDRTGSATTVSTSAGDVTLPIRYRDVSAVAALFTIPAELARDLLTPLGVRPVTLPRGRGLASLVFYEYRRTSVGAYNEVGLAIASLPAGSSQVWAIVDPARRVRRRRLGFAIIDLPVTTELADAAGREIWGYPKFLTEITVRFAGRRFQGSVRDPARAVDIVTLTGDLGRGVRAPVFDLVTYTRHEDRTWRTVVDVRGSFRAHRGRGIRVEIGASDHPMANHLRTLSLDAVRPGLVLVSHNWRSLLHAGQPI